MDTQEYNRKLVNMAALAGDIMMRSGAETHRVEDTLSRILGMARSAYAEALVLTTGLVVTLSDGEHEPLSITKRITGDAQNLGRVWAVNSVSRSFCAGNTDIDTALARLEEIRTERQYSDFLVSVGLVLSSAFFSILFGGSFLDAAGGLLCGMMLVFVKMFLGPKINRSFITTMLCAAGITICSTAAAFVSDLWFGLHIQSQYMIVGAMMPLVPGLAMTSAIRDVLQGDYISAGSRALEAIMIAASVALGVGAGIALSDVLSISYTLNFSFDFSAPDAWSFVKGVLSCAIAVFGFALIFDIPKKYVPATCTVAAVSWAAFLLCDGQGFSSPWASFFAVLVADFLAHRFARWIKAPVTLFLIGGLLPLVPGIGIYRAVYDVIYGPGVSSGVQETLLITGAIALAIFVIDTVFEIETRIRNYYRKKRQNKA